MVDRAPLPQVVGFRLRELRQKVGLSQDDIATAAQRLGLAWRRSSVAMLEQGRRGLSAEELLLLPFVLNEAVRGGNPDAEVAYEVPLSDLLTPGSREVLALTDAFGLKGKQVEAWLGADPPDVVPWKRQPDIPEADRHAAAFLGVPVETVQDAARRLWAQTLTEERDRRVAESADPKMSPRSRQAHRALVTRALHKELADAVKKES